MRRAGDGPAARFERVEDVSEHDDSRTCAFHPDRPTMLSCTRCERPACPDCLVPAAVGMHCVACVSEQRREAPGVARELTAHQRAARRPGWLFWTMLGTFAVLCALLAAQSPALDGISNLTRLLGFGVVILGWLISLALHEWAHAYTAFRSGDHSVLGRGYLTLDIRKYTDLLMSVALPVVFLLLGGIPLPGGAVWINEANIPSRRQRSMVSAAGPAMNILFGIACLAIVKTGVLDGAPALELSLIYLGWLEFLTAAINLLPVPGLDGFGIIRPYLPYNVQVAAMNLSFAAIIILFIVLWNSPQALGFLFDLSDGAVATFGFNELQVALGQYISDITELTGGT